MFSNFIYILVALVIYTSSDLFSKSHSPSLLGVGVSLVIFLCFTLACRMAFGRLARRAAGANRAAVDQGLNILITRFSIAALCMFAVNIHYCKLNLFLSNLPLFQTVPTLAALVFLCIFLFYLAVTWNFAYQVQRLFFPGSLTKKDFIRSNISFCLPAILPWVCLSLFADIIQLLPFEPIKAALSTEAGEVLYIVVFLSAAVIFGPVLIQKLWGCSPLEPGIQRDRIEKVCRRAGLGLANILKWELFGGSMITAGVTGLVGKFRYILVTPALLNCLDEEEVESVILHEIGHVQKHHMLFYLMFFAGFIACNFVFFEPVMWLLYLLAPIYKGFGILGVSKPDGHALLLTSTLIACFVLYFRFGFGFFMRHFERQADLHVYRFKPDASALISTFKKIAFLSGQSMDRPNWHHFSIGQRIAFLERCQADPDLISRHHARVKKMMAGFFLALILVFSLGYTLNYGIGSEAFSGFIARNVLTQELELDPDNSDLYVLVADYYYEKKSYQKAVEAYENVIRINRTNIHALNNLAWLFATCPDQDFRDPERSLNLALKALALKRQAFVLDTYAEALFVNNRVSEAILAAQEALEISDSKKIYYRDQLQRFQRAKNHHLN